MRQYIPVITLIVLVALVLAAVSGGLLPVANVVYAQNNAPVFDAISYTRSVPENTPPGTNIGGPLTATDADGDTLTYSLEGSGSDVGKFDIDLLTGQLLTKEPLNVDPGGADTYTPTVKATDPSGDTDTAVATITVADVNEPPAAPVAPTVVSGLDNPSTDDSDESTTSLNVNWDAPDNTGRESITGYDVQYKKVSDSDFSDPVTASGTNAHTISNLDAGVAYHVRVRAKNTDVQANEGPWSLVGTGETNTEGNTAPTFSSETITLSVAENTPTGQNVGAAVRATDNDSTTLVYSLKGRDADSFDIVPTSGQILTKSALNYDVKLSYAMNNDAKRSYAMLVKVVDGDGGSAVASLTIMVTNVTESPSAPGMPTVVPGEDDEGTTDGDESTTTLKVTWDAPENTGPPITGTDTAIYTVEYRKGTSGAFGTTNVVIDGTTATITLLEADTSYQVRVKAHNGEGESPYSPTGAGSTNAGNRAPEFSIGTTSRSIPENTPAGRNIGAPVRATDDDGDTLTYSMEGTDADSFNIDASTGQIKTKSALNYEETSSYAVTVKAEDVFGAGTIAMTITVTDQNEVPSAPEKPTVTSVTDDQSTGGVDESTTQLSVSWPAPDNMGPLITGYELQYRVRNSGSFTPVSDSVNMQNSTITVKITGLTEHTQYEVQVRATNDEGTGSYSASGIGYTNTAGNDLPSFGAQSATRTIPENTPEDTNVGSPITATDGGSDNDPLTYSMEGTDADSFNINSSNGQTTTKTGVTYNYEAKPSHSLIVKVEDSEGGSSTIAVTISLVDDTTEEPEMPSAPTVTTNTDDLMTSDLDEATSSLNVSWDEPANTGPDINAYQVQYNIKDSSDAFVTVTCEETGGAASMECFEDRKVTIGDSDNGLEDGTTYAVQVLARNAEGDSPWSNPGTGTTVEANNRPVFSSGTTATRSVAENAQSGQNVGAPVTATDRDSGILTYTMEGPGADSFTINSSTGQIGTSSALHYESRQSYSVTVKADDGTGTRNSFAAISVTLMVNDVDEPPSTPAAPTVWGISGSTDSVLVTWEEPSNVGPPITDYDLQYREGSSGNYRSWSHHGMDMSTTVTGLKSGTSYQFQVLANNAEGPSQWSSPGSGMPNSGAPNNPPVFPVAPPTLEVPENTAAGENIGDPVTATDPDQDTLTYTLEGVDAASFDIIPETGQIQTKVPLNYEEKSSYAVTVKAEDGRGESATIDVTITVTNVDNEPPSVPSAPTVTPTPDSATSLDVTWDAPDNQGSPITDYDYRYTVESFALFKFWTTVDDTTITDTMVTIENLTTGTGYEVQVRATNAGGTTDWSDSGIGTPEDTSANTPPAFSSVTTSRVVAENTPEGTYIDDPISATDDDPNDTLTYSLSSPDASSFNIDDETGQLMTSASLDYEFDSHYMVTVAASDGRDSAEIQVTIAVTDMYPGCTTQVVGNSGLTNDCEALLDSKNALEGTSASPLNWAEGTPMAQWNGINFGGTPQRVTTVNLIGMGLTGSIPDALGRLSMLTHLILRSNPGLSGEIPGALGNLGNLRVLNLHSNSHTGAVPDLSGIAGLEELYLANNADYEVDGDKVAGSGLTGQIPTWLNGMTNMRELWLWGNSLSGTIPNLSGMTSLEKLKLANNDLDGGIGGGIPDASRLPPNMTWLIIDRNPFGGTIPNLSSLSRLRLLWLHSSRLTGTVPAGNNYPASLDDLNLRDNMLTGEIPDLSNLDNLTRLRLHNNSLSGEVPATLGDLDNLKQLWLHNEVNKGRGNNSFTSIAAGVGDLADTLIEIALDGNPWNANACVPAELANVAKNDYTAAGIEVCSANGGS